MDTVYRRGIRRALIFYLSGIMVTFIVHMILGWEKMYLMPCSALVIVFTIMISLPWAFLNLTNLLCSSKKSQQKGELLVHGIVFALVAGFIIYVRLLI